ncbi:MAG TPA: 50S ribosomal protein L25/general stress protein Ctc [Burkholderiales bacterium]|nr:50S ribosomal protein L25/general stress protein Ctc [Burkholderiales bacterium]
MEVTATSRTLQGTGASRRLRRAGRVPGILYGGKQQAQIIELDHNALYHLLKLEAFHASILNMNLDGKKQQVLLRELHMHPFKMQVMHVDFQRVAKDKKIYIKVPLHFINADLAPGVKVDGGIVSHVMNEVEVSCLPADLPEFIEVDLANLKIGDSVHLADLKFPKGVESVALVRGNNAVVATVQIPKVIVVEEVAAVPAAEEAAAAEGAAAEAVPATGEKKEGEKSAAPDAGKKEGGKAPEAGKKEGGKQEKK